MRQKTLKSSILDLRIKKYTINEICSELGCAKSTVSFHLNNNGLGGQIKKEKNILSDLDKLIIEKVINLRTIKKTYKEIQKEVKISLDKISKICRENNLPGVYRNKHVTVDEAIIKKINDTYQEIKNIRKTAKFLNLSRKTIQKYIIIIDRKLGKDKRKQKMVEYVNIARQKRRKELIEYKGSKCEICNYNKKSSALQFHHLNPDEKDFTIGGKNYSWERMKKEVDKCILVCANCHCEIHDEIRENGKSIIIDKWRITQVD